MVIITLLFPLLIIPALSNRLGFSICDDEKFLWLYFSMKCNYTCQYTIVTASQMDHHSLSNDSLKYLIMGKHIDKPTFSHQWRFYYKLLEQLLSSLNTILQVFLFYCLLSTVISPPLLPCLPPSSSSTTTSFFFSLSIQSAMPSTPSPTGFTTLSNCN